MDVKKEEGRSWALAFAGARWRQLRGRAWCASAAALLRGVVARAEKLNGEFFRIYDLLVHMYTQYYGVDMSLSSDFVFVHVQYMCLNQVISKKLGWYGNAGLVSSRSLVRGPFSLESPAWLRYIYMRLVVQRYACAPL